MPTLARTMDELKNLLTDRSQDVVRDMSGFLAKAASGNTALSKVPTDVALQFLATLEFKGLGRAHCQIGLLRPYVSREDEAEFMTIFGLAPELYDAADPLIQGHFCTPGGGCVPVPNWVCVAFNCMAQ